MRTNVGVRIACLDLVSGCHGEPLEVVDVDLNRFQGRWYEIAKLPRPDHAPETPPKASRELRASGPKLTEAAGPAHRSDSNLRVIGGAVTVTSATAPAKLSVDSGGSIADGWIIELDPEYRYAVIGHPTRNSLWIVNRSPNLDGATLSSILDRAHARGFDVSRLEFAKTHVGRSAA
jgi:apolipoprotein D and lipocalin family protein